MNFHVPEHGTVVTPDEKNVNCQGDSIREVLPSGLG